jgi:hypothetical protein
MKRIPQGTLVAVPWSAMQGALIVGGVTVAAITMSVLAGDVSAGPSVLLGGCAIFETILGVAWWREYRRAAAWSPICQFCHRARGGNESWLSGLADEPFEAHPQCWITEMERAGEVLAQRLAEKTAEPQRAKHRQASPLHVVKREEPEGDA